ncbi:uncharacterized protein LOC117780970 [Drosophila innubila]|uniref:uncharacterized protein LOC117780970 n=1 Tax=Drosophila innubila TaxID=198719 RepID=UPI00148D91A7|nr:uncharacterized protein LOC117780970 [Drosophila innubila]
MKNKIIWLLISMVLVQESKTSCAEWKQPETNCVNDFANQTNSLAKYDNPEKLVQEKLDVFDKRMEDIRRMIELALLSQTEQNIKRNVDFLESLQNVEHQLEKIKVQEAQWDHNLDNHNNLTKASSKKVNSDCIAKLLNIEQLLKEKFEEQEEKLKQKLEIQNKITKSLWQKQIDNIKPRIDSMVKSDSLKIIQEKFETLQKAMETQISNSITQFESIKNQMQDNVENFRKIGLKYYYIEQSENLSWYGSFHKCLTLGGHLVSITNLSEFNAITTGLQPHKHYWMDVNDLGTEGLYLSAATGLQATYLNWHTDNPGHNITNHCGELRFHENKHLMYISDCNDKELFICEFYYQ